MSGAKGVPGPCLSQWHLLWIKSMSLGTLQSSVCGQVRRGKRVGRLFPLGPFSISPKGHPCSSIYITSKDTRVTFHSSATNEEMTSETHRYDWHLNTDTICRLSEFSPHSVLLLRVWIRELFSHAGHSPQ